MQSLSGFQKTCRKRLSVYLDSHGLEPEFKVVLCRDADFYEKGEVYLQSKQMLLNGTEVQFFIYIDEAGFFCDGDWHICEVQDYPGDESLLISRLLEQIDACAGLRSPHPYHSQR